MDDLQAELARLRQENAPAGGKNYPKNSGGVLREGVDVKYAWIAGEKHAHSVTMMCDLLDVSRSGWHQSQKRPKPVRAVTDESLTEEIRERQRRHRGRYGRRRITREVGAAQTTPVNEKRFGRLMREAGVQSRMRKRFRVVTTDSKHKHPIAPNVLARDFMATAPNEK